MDYIELIKSFDIHIIIAVSVIFYKITKGWRAEMNEMKKWRAETKEEIACIRKDAEYQAFRTYQLQIDFYNAIEKQDRRIDRLYYMSVDLAKEIRDNKNK